MDGNRLDSNEKSWRPMSGPDSGSGGPDTILPMSPKFNAEPQTQELPRVTSMSGTSGFASKARADLPEGTSLASIFRYHLGIEHDDFLVPAHLATKKAIDPIDTGRNEGRRAVNLGIYNRAIREERMAHLKFRLWSVVINVALGAQIIFAAILTALGAGNGPNDAVAAFGTLNTIIAGFLTYLKGTGLPMRMKYFHNQWLKLRAYIEQRERDFAADDNAKLHRYGYTEVMEEVEIVEKMYHNIRKEVEKHTPDSFGGSKGESGGDENHAPGEGAPTASLAQKGLNALRNRLATAQTDAGNTRHGFESRVSGAIEDVERRVATHLQNHLNKVEEHTQAVRNAAQNTELQVRDLEKGAQTTINDSLDRGELAMEDVDDVIVERLRTTQARALEAQKQAELKVKELEKKLADMDRSMAERTMPVARDQQAGQESAFSPQQPPPASR